MPSMSTARRGGVPTKNCLATSFWSDSMVTRVYSVAGHTHVFAPPYRLNGQRLPIRSAPPTLGEGTRELLNRLLDLSDAQLEHLRAQGVLTLPG